MKQILILIMIVALLIGNVEAAISGISVKVNESVPNWSTSTDRVIMGTNATINISYTDSAISNYTNISFPLGWSFGGLVYSNIVNNTGATAIIKSGRWVNISHPAKAAGAVIYNFTANVNANATSQDQTISVQTYNSSAVTVAIYTRNSSRPFYLSANNSNYVVSSETFASTPSATMVLTGSGGTNMTIYVPLVTGQTNATLAWGATNAGSIQVLNKTTYGIMYLITDTTLTSPTIVIQPMTSASANLPAALLAIGGIGTGVYILYRKLKKTR